MSSELLAQLATMSVEDMRELQRELEDRLSASEAYDLSETPDGKAALTELLDERLQHYQEHPESAAPWEEVHERLQKRMADWKAARQTQ